MHKCCCALHALQAHMALDNSLVSVEYWITSSPCKLIPIYTLCAQGTVSHAYNNCFISSLYYYCEKRNYKELLA